MLLRNEFSVPIIDQPPINPDLNELFTWLPNKEKTIEFIDRFRPWDQWSIRNISNGKYEINDTYLPPSQTGEAPMIDTPHIPGGYMTATLEARVPASALFGIGRSFLRGNEMLGTASYGAAGPFSVVDLNRDGHSGSVWEDSPIVKVTNEWRSRMGVVSDYEYAGAAINLRNNTYISFNTGYNSGWARPYGAYNTQEMAEIGYGMVMLGHYLQKVKPNAGDYFFAKINIGKNGPSRLVAIEIKEWREKYHSLTCHPLGEGFAKLAKQALAATHPTESSAIPSELPLWLTRAEASYVLQVACGRNVHLSEGQDDREIVEQKANALSDELVSFVINTPDHRASIARYYNR